MNATLTSLLLAIMNPPSIVLEGIPNMKQEPTDSTHFDDTSTPRLPLVIGCEHEEVGLLSFFFCSAVSYPLPIASYAKCN